MHSILDQSPLCWISWDDTRRNMTTTHTEMQALRLIVHMEATQLANLEKFYVLSNQFYNTPMCTGHVWIR